MIFDFPGTDDLLTGKQEHTSSRIPGNSFPGIPGRENSNPSESGLFSILKFDDCSKLNL